MSKRLKVSLKRSPPQSESKKILSDFLRLNFISRNPIKKFIIERNAPSNIDLKINPDMPDRKKSKVTMSMVRKEIIKAKI